MATLTMTPSRFGSSFSGARDQALHGSDASAMASSLPKIDFGFDDLRARMSQFTARFDDFIDRGRRRVLEERNAFRMKMAEMEDVQRTRNIAIAELESRSSSHARNLAKEATEAEEMEDAIRTLTDRKEEHIARRNRLRGDIASIQSSIRQKREAQAVHQRSLEAQARHNIPELRFWEHCLGLRIDGSGSGVADQLRFVFVCIDERDASKEAWFELHMGGKDYEIPDTSPKLESESLDPIVGSLNETREIGSFLKAIRALFVEALRP